MFKIQLNIYLNSSYLYTVVTYYVIYRSKNTSLKMVTIGGRNM